MSFTAGCMILIFNLCVWIQWIQPCLHCQQIDSCFRSPASTNELHELERSILRGNVTNIYLLNQMCDFTHSNDTRSTTKSILSTFLQTAVNPLTNYQAICNTINIIMDCDQFRAIINQNCLLYEAIYSKSIKILEIILATMDSTEIQYCFNQFKTKNGLKLFDIATKTRTSTFAKFLLYSVNNHDLKLIRNRFKLMSLDANKMIDPRMIEYNLSIANYMESKIIPQIEMKYLSSLINEAIMKVLIKYALQSEVNVEILLLEKKYDSDKYNEQNILEQWIETHSLENVERVLKEYQLDYVIEQDYINIRLNKHLLDVADIEKYNQSQYVAVCEKLESVGDVDDHDDEYAEDTEYTVCCPNIIDNWDEFFNFYWKYQIPVIIRLKPEKTCTLVSEELDAVDININSIVQLFGNETLKISEIPYGDLFGKDAFTSTLSNYYTSLMSAGGYGRGIGIETGMENDLDLEIKPYVFDRDVLKRNEDMMKYFIDNDSFWNYLKYECGFEYSMQFIMGGNNTGSPFHWHSPAFNRLYIGNKKWWMYPPNQSIYTSIHPYVYINNNNNNTSILDDNINVFQFIQQPGDIVFAPNEWAHCTLNINDTLAVASEIKIHAK